LQNLWYSGRNGRTGSLQINDTELTQKFHGKKRDIGIIISESEGTERGEAIKVLS
jgi:hypothetical protein